MLNANLSAIWKTDTVKHICWLFFQFWVQVKDNSVDTLWFYMTFDVVFMTFESRKHDNTKLTCLTLNEWRTGEVTFRDGNLNGEWSQNRYSAGIASWAYTCSQFYQ